MLNGPTAPSGVRAWAAAGGLRSRAPPTSLASAMRPRYTSKDAEGQSVYRWPARNRRPVTAVALSNPRNRREALSRLPKSTSLAAQGVALYIKRDFPHSAASCDRAVAYSIQEVAEVVSPGDDKRQLTPDRTGVEQPGAGHGPPSRPAAEPAPMVREWQGQPTRSGPR